MENNWWEESSGCVMYSILFSGWVFTVKIEEKVAALLVYSSLKAVASISLRRISVSTSSDSQKPSSSAQIRSEYEFTPYSV